MDRVLFPCGIFGKTGGVRAVLGLDDKAKPLEHRCAAHLFSVGHDGSFFGVAGIVKQARGMLAHDGHRRRIYAASAGGSARLATAGEVPIGAILVHDGKIVARSGNRTIRDCDPTAHAEIVVLREASRAIGNYRLAGTTLYVTTEPCSMCAGAMIQARVPRLVYGCDDPKGGAVRSCFEFLATLGSIMASR